MMGRENQGKAVLRNPVQELNSEIRKLQNIYIVIIKLYF